MSLFVALEAVAEVVWETHVAELVVILASALEE